MERISSFRADDAVTVVLGLRLMAEVEIIIHIQESVHHFQFQLNVHDRLAIY